MSNDYVVDKLKQKRKAEGKSHLEKYCERLDFKFGDISKEELQKMSFVEFWRRFKVIKQRGEGPLAYSILPLTTKELLTSVKIFMPNLHRSPK